MTIFSNISKTLITKWNFNQKKKNGTFELHAKSHYTFDDLLALVYFMILRMLSFCLDKLNIESSPATKYLKTNANHYKSKCQDDYTLKNFIFYTMYPSFLFISPFVSFKSFILCVSIQVDNSNLIYYAIDIKKKYLCSCRKTQAWKLSTLKRPWEYLFASRFLFLWSSLFCT